jgi:predicted metal-binding protein
MVLFRCPGCNAIFKSINEYEIHGRECKIIRTVDLCACVKCGRHFKSSRLARGHEKTCNPSKPKVNPYIDSTILVSDRFT